MISDLTFISSSTYADEIIVCSKSSPPWRNDEKLKLKLNILVQSSDETFSKQLLDISYGNVTIDECTGRMHNITNRFP